VTQRRLTWHARLTGDQAHQGIREEHELNVRRLRAGVRERCAHGLLGEGANRSIRLLAELGHAGPGDVYVLHADHQVLRSWSGEQAWRVANHGEIRL